jgi:hypothetical protein
MKTVFVDSGLVTNVAMGIVSTTDHHLLVQDDTVVSVGWIINADGSFSPPEIPAEEKIASLETALRSHLDATCKDAGFDNYQSAMNWAGFPNPYQTTASSLADWIAACWSTHFQILSEINSTHVIPTISEYLEKLPKVGDFKS